MLNTLTIKAKPTSEASEELKTPIICRAVRQFQKTYKTDPNIKILSKLFKANLYLSAQHTINYHIKQGLLKSIKDLKKNNVVTNT